jgi:lipoprotein-anchoring transpeptidase ErfK/SrfK
VWLRAVWCVVVVLVAAACTSSPSVAVLGPEVTVVPKDTADKVSPIEPVEVAAKNAKLDSVSVTNPEGKQVNGKLSADRTRWTSAEPLGYGREYTVAAVASGANGKKVRKTVSFTTLQPAQTVYPSFFPPPSISTVGVGQPIAVIFDKPPADRAAAERALKVRTEPATEGGWYWRDDRTVHWRPKEYWRPGTKVTVDARIYGVNLGEGMYGKTSRTLNYTIGPAKIATIDDRTHQMTVTVDGKTVQQFPVSMGRSDSATVDGKTISFITPSGTYVAQEKYEVKQMSSASYGLPTDNALGYDSQIPLAVRISNSGIFVHAAPWSVADQGVRNVSHGCINLSPEAGRWFYDNFSYGDIVTVANTSTQLEPTNGFGDWNIPWDEWLEGSALR